MVIVKGIVDIQSSPEQVFALVSDVRQCGELNPHIEVIDIAAQPTGQMQQGTIYHYRIVVEGRMIEYTSKVLEYESNHFVEIQTNTDPVVNIRYSIEPTSDGSRLEQQLTSSVTYQQSELLDTPGWFVKLFGKLVKDGNSDEEREKLIQQQEAMMQKELQMQLNEWLAIVKKYLEEQHGKLLA